MKTTHQQEPPISAPQIPSAELDQKDVQPHSIAAVAASPLKPSIVSDSDHQVTNNNYRYS